MKRTTKFPYCFLVVLPFLFFGCEIESIDSDNQESIVELSVSQKIKKNFTWKSFEGSTEITQRNLEVSWSDYIVHNVQGAKWYEFGIKQSNLVHMESLEITDVTFSLLATVKKSGAIVYYLNMMNSYNGDSYSSYFSLRNGLYSGMVHLYNQSGKIIVMQYYRKGELISSIMDENFDISSIPSSLTALCTQRTRLTSHCENTWDCTPSDAPGCDPGGNISGQYVLQYTGHYTDWYMDRNGNGTAEANEYSSTDFNGYTSQWVWVPGSGSGPLYNTSWGYNMYLCPGSAGYTNLNYNPAGLVAPDRIIFDLNMQNTKALCVYHKLEELSDGFRDAIRKFDGDFPVSHLKFSMKDLPSNVNGVTSNVSDYLIEISFNMDRTPNRPHLGIANTFIHEVIHA